jgi:hypothetical protein
LKLIVLQDGLAKGIRQEEGIMARMVFGLFLFVALIGCGVEWFPPHQTLPPSVSTTTLPAGTVSTPYSATLVASGGTAPYTWSVTTGTLPAGLTLSAAGAISGTPTAAGTSTFTVTVSDSSSPVLTATQTLVIQVT